MIELKNLLAGYDTFERHRLVGSLVRKLGGGKVLDVGGSPGVLASFARTQVIVTNLGRGEVLSNGLSLPFAPDTFDVVTSLDVLEHLPEPKRRPFIRELVRVAKKSVILCMPYGSQAHSDQEKLISGRLSAAGVSNPMLEEHIRYGLPRLAQVTAYLEEFAEYDAWFTGDFRYNHLMFTIDHWKGTSFKWIKVVISILLTVVGNLCVYPLIVSKRPRSSSNRMTFMITKNE